MLACSRVEKLLQIKQIEISLELCVKIYVVGFHLFPSVNVIYIRIEIMQGSFYVLESQPSFYLPGRDCPTRSKAEDGERKS